MGVRFRHGVGFISVPSLAGGATAAGGALASHSFAGYAPQGLSAEGQASVVGYPIDKPTLRGVMRVRSRGCSQPY